MKENPIMSKSEDFALHIVSLYQYLVNEKKEFILSKQILRSGTSIGANVAESNRAQSKADFYSKLNIALKEADETSYWLRLLSKSGYIPQDKYSFLYEENEEIIRILVSITKNQKDNDT